MVERDEERSSEFVDLFDHAPCGYVIARADGRIEGVNSTPAGVSQKMGGYRPRPLRGD